MNLFSLVPKDYGPALFLDIRALRDNPELEQVLKLDVLRLLATLPPGATSLMDHLVWKSPDMPKKTASI